MVKVLDRSNLFSIDCNSAVDLSCVASSELTCPQMQQLIGSGLDRPSTWDCCGRLCTVPADSCDTVDLSRITLSLLSWPILGEGELTEYKHRLSWRFNHSIGVFSRLFIMFRSKTCMFVCLSWSVHGLWCLADPIYSLSIITVQLTCPAWFYRSWLVLR